MESQLFQPLGEDIFSCHSACLKYESDHSRKKLSDVAMYFSAPTCLVGNAAYPLADISPLSDLLN